MADTTAAPNQPESEPVLDIERHLRYWRMCLESPLPRHYLPNEGNRMALAYFIVNAAAILAPSCTTAAPLIPPADRRRLRQWVLTHQQSGGGFAASSSLVFPTSLRGEGKAGGCEVEEGEGGEEGAGHANLPGTLFALQLLALLADEGDEAGAFDGVDRVRTLRWLRRLQRADGSFGEAVKLLPGHGWFIAGGYDSRYCYLAASIRWMLRGYVREGESGWVEDIDTEGLAKYILSSQTYDGGFAGSSKEEPHAGYAYCAIGALTLLDRPLGSSTTPHPSKILHSGIRDMPGLVHWLVSRQFAHLDPEHPNDSDSDDDEPANFLLPSHPADLTSPSSLRHVGCNGRTNKVADTCYTWWVGAALANLGRGELLDWPASRRFLLERMAHRVGGFSKHPGDPPDVYHGCFGLCALAVMGEPGLSPLDSALAVPVATVAVIEKARAALVERAKGGRKGSGGRAVEMGLAMRGTKPGWLAAAGG